MATISSGLPAKLRHALRAHIPFIAIGLAAMAALIALSPTLSRRLQYDRESIYLHQYWRLLSCHWSHWSIEHLSWDALTFVLLGAACERWSRTRFLVFLGIATPLIPLVVHRMLPTINNYRGLSGIDAGLLTLLLAMVVRTQIGLRQYRFVALAGAAFIALAAKLVIEFGTGSTVFVTWSGVRVVPLPMAHLLGAVVGLVVGFARKPGETRRDARWVMEEARASVGTVIAP